MLKVPLIALKTFVDIFQLCAVDVEKVDEYSKYHQ